MKLSNERMLNDVAILRDISQRQLPIKASYAISKNILKIERELEAYSKERQRLIDQYAEKDADGKVKTKDGQIVIKEDCVDKWNNSILELLSIENDIDIHKFSIDELEGYNMSPAELMAIDYMIND